jgi:ubiquinol-cytochrome c reductase cytochrome b subunit
MKKTMGRSFGKKIYDWIEYRLPIFSFIKHVGEYRVPKNLSYLWSFGSLAGIALVLQILTGLFLAMQYTPHVDLAFDSVERIMRDVNFGWLLRYLHAVGASMFFVVIYLHIARAFYYGSYKSPRELVWFLGIIIFLIMMATAFMGYVLPWGQMSFWGAKVITNLFSAFPVVGEDIVLWLWGGYNVDNPTLNRFFVLHFLLPFVIVAIVLVHIVALHIHGSNNPTGVPIKTEKDSIPFHPYYTLKDFVGFGFFFIVFFYFVFYQPNVLGIQIIILKQTPWSRLRILCQNGTFCPSMRYCVQFPISLLGLWPCLVQFYYGFSCHGWMGQRFGVRTIVRLCACLLLFTI